MALNLGTITLTGQERTCSVSRALPANGQFCITIEREILFKDEAGVINARNLVSPAMVITIGDLLRSPAAATYLKSCNAAPSLLHLMHAESVLYDMLVQERKEAVAAAALKYQQDQEAAAAQVIIDQQAVAEAAAAQAAAALLVQQRAAEALRAAMAAG